MKRTPARLILECDGEVSELALHPGSQILGRSKTCDLVVRDGSLSKQHVDLVLADGFLTVTDVGSKNGIQINGNPSRGGALSNGDVLRCGKLTFKVGGVKSSRVEPEERVGPVLGPFLQLLETDVKFPLTGEVLTLGSRPTNDIVLTGEGVSRYHAELIYEEASWWIRDLGARNGVKVGDSQIDSDRKLVSGDEIELGTARLRFSIAAPNPLASAQKAAYELTRDPLGTIKTNPRVRRGLAAAVLAAVLLAFAGPGGGADLVMNSHSSAGPWLATGAKHLVAGEYELARTVFRRRGKVYSETGDSTPRVLAQIAGQWMQLDERGPRVFRWEKAGDLLKSSARLKGLPPALRSWLEQQSERIDLNAKALLAIAEADQLGARAAGLAKEGKLEHALETYERAAHQYESVNSKSMVSREALASSAKLGNEAFGHLTQSLREGAKAARPDWRHLQGRIEAGQRFAVDGKDRALLRRLGEACRTNLEDEGRFVDAGKLIKQQNAARFGEAKKLLEAVDPRSKIYPDALAYLEWLEADAKVRDAVSAYRRAFGKRAFELLAEAYSSSSLGAAAKESISIRRSHWVRVVRSYERGMASSHRGDKLKAMGELKRVVELEQDPTNLYRVRAKDELEDIKGTLSDQLRGRLESGLQALKRGELREAGRWFDEVNEDPIKSRRDLAMIEAAVAKRNTRERLLVKAKGQLIRDNRKEFLQLRDVFSLLARWLPARSEDRAQAEKHLKVVAARLRFWEKVAERALK